MNNNGKTIVEYLTPVPGGTAADATYLLALDHYTCCGRRICTNEAYLVSADLKFTPLGQPVSLGNDTYCQEVLCSGTCTYQALGGCCPRVEPLFATICVPCSSAATPTITAGTCAASPTNVQPCCSVTDCIAITTSINVATGA